MSRIQIKDLPTLEEMTPEQLKELFGAGRFTPQLEALEERMLLNAASITDWRIHDEPFYDPSITVRGSEERDVIEIDYVDESQSDVRIVISDAAGNVTVDEQFNLEGLDYLSVHGKGGNDEIHNNTAITGHISGGNGNDLIFGGEGSDFIRGWVGNDTIDGGGGDDEIEGNSGADVIFGGAGNDELWGRHQHGQDPDGNDEIHGGIGDDIIHGGTGDDVLHGDEGDDVIEGGIGSDRLFGDAGADYLYGTIPDAFETLSRDILYLDEFDPIPANFYDGIQSRYNADYFDLEDGVLTINGTDDWETIVVDYWGENNELVRVNVGSVYGHVESWQTIWTPLGRIAEWVVPADQVDSLVINTLAGPRSLAVNFTDIDSTMFGGDGDDKLFGGSGDDVLYGGEGDDWLVGTIRFQDLDFDDGLSFANLNYAVDGTSITYAAFVESEPPVSDSDHLYGEEGSDLLFGRGGNDYLDGGADDDILGGGMGDDEMFGGDGDDVLVGDDERNLAAWAGNDGMAGDDVMDGGDGDDFLYGGAGDDQIEGGGGADEIYGESGNDNIYTDTEDDHDDEGDVIVGGSGIDTVNDETMDEDKSSGSSSGSDTDKSANSDSTLALAELAYKIDQKFGLSSNGNYSENWGGLGEKWISGANNSWFFITRDGAFYQWNGKKDIAKSELVATLDHNYYADPSKLHDAQAPEKEKKETTSSESFAELAYKLNQKLDLSSTGNYSHNWGGLGEKWIRGANNSWFFITDAGTLYQWNGEKNLTSAKAIAQLDTSFYVDPAKLHEAKNPVLEDLASDLDRKYQFSSTGNYYENWGGLGEKWLTGADNSWYFITKDGSLFHWNGEKDLRSCKEIAQLDGDFFQDPSQLHKAHA